MHYALCPYCLSTLKITEEQLTLRAGLVRCKHCSDVFNAYKNKLPESERQRVIKSIKEQEKKADTEIKIPHPDKADQPQSSPEAVTWEAAPKENRSSFPFGLISFLLALILMGQIVYIQSDTIVQTPRFQPFFKQVNNAFGFSIPSYKSADEIQIIERQLTPHPTVANILTLRLTMKNTALAEQNFPSINLVLTSNSGEVIAHKTFTKYDYLTTREKYDFFKAQSLKQISLSFKEVQKDTSGFEISFSF